MKLLIITQKVDQDDDLLGFFVDWLREFAKHFDRIHVIALEKGNYSLPDNVSVHSLGKELGRSKLFQAVKFYKLLFKFTPETDGLFAHMSPIFVIASWPVTMFCRKKIIFWYLHRSLTLKLKIADALCFKIVTATKESLRLKSNKIIEVGHGIKVENFETRRDWSDPHPPKIISVGRISPIKNFELLIKAVNILHQTGIDFSVEIIGQPVMAGDSQYLTSLQGLVSDLQLKDLVKFVGFVPHSQIARYYQEANICVGPLPTGGLDKAMLEAMAAGCLTLTSNTAFSKYFSPYSEILIFKNDPEELAQKIQELSDLSEQQKKEVADFLVGVVKKEHELNRLIESISHFFRM